MILKIKNYVYILNYLTLQNILDRTALKDVALTLKTNATNSGVKAAASPPWRHGILAVRPRLRADGSITPMISPVPIIWATVNRFLFVLGPLFFNFWPNQDTYMRLLLLLSVTIWRKCKDTSRIRMFLIIIISFVRSSFIDFHIYLSFYLFYILCVFL